MLHAPIGFIAPVFAGWIYDTTGNYNIAFITIVVIAVVAALLLYLAKPPKPPAEVTDIEKFI